MKKLMTLFVVYLSIYAMSLSMTAMAADGVTAKQTTNYQELTQDELAVLDKAARNSANLSEEMAGRECEEVCERDRYGRLVCERQCKHPNLMACIIGGVGGGVIGMLGGGSGVIIGASLGCAIFYGANYALQ